MYSKYISFSEFQSTRDNELKILDQLTPLENYKVDDDGDLIVISQNPLQFEIESLNPSSIIELPNGEKINGTVKNSVIDNYGDVFGLDNPLSEQAEEGIRNLKLLTFWDKNEFQGCVWTFEDDKYFGIYAIRTSLTNFLTNVKGTASFMLNDIIKKAKQRKIIVPWPLESMLPLLKKLDFQEYNIDIMNKEIRFLEPITYTINYWIHYPIVMIIKTENEYNKFFFDGIKNNKIVCFKSSKKFKIPIENLSKHKVFLIKKLIG